MILLHYKILRIQNTCIHELEVINQMLDILENICILLAKAEQAHLQQTKKRFVKKGLDITPVQWLVLFTLYKKDGESITQLANRCYLDNSTITGVIDRLENAGYVSRQPLEGDRRVYKIVLLPKAYEIKDKATEITDGIFHDMSDGCSEEEIAIFRKVLLNIFEKLSEKENEHEHLRSYKRT